MYKMSQSDFLQYKKLYTELKIKELEIKKIPPNLSSQEYTLYKQFMFENVNNNRRNSKTK